MSIGSASTCALMDGPAIDAAGGAAELGLSLSAGARLVKLATPSRDVWTGGIGALFAASSNAITGHFRIRDDGSGRIGDGYHQPTALPLRQCRNGSTKGTHTI